MKLPSILDFLMLRYYKVTNNELNNRGFQLVIGENFEPDFDPNPKLECSKGLYFCTPSQVLYWARNLDYNYVLDVEVPSDAKVVNFPDKSRANKLVLSNHRPITDICEEIYDLDDKFGIIEHLIRHGRLESLRKIYETYGDLFKVCPSSMVLATINGHLDIIKYFLSVGATCTSDEMDWASCKGHISVVKFYHSIGIKCTKNAMDFASENGHLEVIKFLHSIGANCTTNAMDWASENGHLEVVKFLYSIGAKCTDWAMNSAIEYNHLEVVKYLHSIGVRYTSVAKELAISGCLEMVKFLYRTGVSYTTNEMNWFALRGNLDVIKYLHSIGVICTQTTLDWAIKGKQTEVVDFLRNVIKK